LLQDRDDLLFAVSCALHCGSPFLRFGRTHILDGPVFGGWVRCKTDFSGDGDLHISLSRNHHSRPSEKSRHWRICSVFAYSTSHWGLGLEAVTISARLRACAILSMSNCARIVTTQTAPNQSTLLDARRRFPDESSSEYRNANGPLSS